MLQIADLSQQCGRSRSDPGRSALVQGGLDGGTQRCPALRPGRLQPPDLVPDDFARTVARWSSCGLHRAAVSLLAERPATFRDQLTAFSGPKRYLSGALSNEDLDPIRDAGCETRVVPDAGHVLMTDNLDSFVDALR